MATYLFTTIAQFKEFVGGGVNVSLKLESISSTMYMAAHEHILPWLGDTTWANLVDAVENDDATADELALLPYVRRPLAMLTMHEYAKIGGIQFSEGGIYRTENEDMGMKSAYKYQENQYRDYMLHNGFESIEHMLRFLDANAATYTEWAAEAMPRQRSLLINYARDFRDVYAKNLDRYTFELLRPIMHDIETFAIRSTLGDAQYERLKAGILAQDLTAAEHILVGHLRRAVANWAIEEGIHRNWIQIRAGRVIQLESHESQSALQDMPAAANAVSLRLRKESEFANRHLSFVTFYLTNHLDDYPLYSTYIDEVMAAVAAAEAEENLCNDPDYRAFPRYCCSSYPHCSCSTTKRKGIVRF